MMKKWTIIFLLTLVVGLTPTTSFAATNNDALRQQLLVQIAVLQKQLIVLLEYKAELASIQTTNDNYIYKSDYYEGEHEAIYSVRNDDLKRVDGTIVRTGDQLLWQAYVDMVGQNFINDHDINEFRIFNNEDTWLSGYVDQKPDGSWILAVNRFGDNLTETYQRDFNVELLLHETGHIIFFTNDTYEEDFTDTFWQNRTADRYVKNLAAAKNESERTRLTEEYYEDNVDDFVTDYAATNATEDLVESFVEFILGDYPNGGDLKDKKVRFFYHYPELVSWRQSLKQSSLVRNAY